MYAIIRYWKHQYIIKVHIMLSYIYVFTQPLCTSKIQHRINFEAEFNRFEIRLFLLLDRLPYLS